MEDRRPSFLRSRAWIGGAILALLLLAGIGALLWHDRAEPAAPALWRISMGDRHGWVMGTIHAVPRHADWQSPAIRAAIEDSDVLMLEVTGLEDERRDRAVFERLGRSPGLAPLAQRVDPADRPPLAALLADMPEPLDPYEDWAAALLIGAAGNSRADASARAAPETVLARAFRREGKPVRGLETIEEQLGRFDTLSAADQHALLGQAIREADEAPELFAALYRSWAAGDVGGLERQFIEPLAAAPGLKQALLDSRNALWAAEIDKALRERGKIPFIAVGAGHVVGPDNLLARLAARGWSIERTN